MSNTDVKERRAHERHRSSIQLQGSPDGGGVVARMVARNLSIGGLYCTSSKDFPEMTRLAVRLALPLKDAKNGAAEDVDVEAIVVRREKMPPATNGDTRYELALFFTNLSDRTKQRLERYLAQR